MPDLVGNPEDRFSCDMAHIYICETSLSLIIIRSPAIGTSKPFPFSIGIPSIPEIIFLRFDEETNK